MLAPTSKDCCVICHEPLIVETNAGDVTSSPKLRSTSEAVVVRPPQTSECHHVFHRSCALMYLATKSAGSSGASAPRRCPVCRRDWQEEGLLEVDLAGNILRHFSMPTPQSSEPSQGELDDDADDLDGDVSLRHPIFQGQPPCIAAPPTRNLNRCNELGGKPSESGGDQPKTDAEVQKNDGDHSKESVQRAEPAMQIRQDYVRTPKRAQRAKLPAAGGSLLLRCPVTGRLVCAEEASSHMRSVLRSARTATPSTGSKSSVRPSARQGTASRPLIERTRAEAATQDVEVALAHFAHRRPDLCGTAEQQHEQLLLAVSQSSSTSAGSAASFEGTGGAAQNTAGSDVL
eukprot:TRINITY_DN8571_c0_g3_i6.p1 TRINITY_DN8571_c0_g3~~TRINITY_DN8571_c0_g3_i6.p1  ORF type:complete len:345 (+),score=56.51 TRINITY_DN8571_c0_g3_i6:50-1084(+)